jgi:hypothetical protein
MRERKMSMDPHYEKLADLVGKALAERWIRVLINRLDRQEHKAPVPVTGGGVGASPAQPAVIVDKHDDPKGKN